MTRKLSRTPRGFTGNKPGATDEAIHADAKKCAVIRQHERSDCAYYDDCLMKFAKMESKIKRDDPKLIPCVGCTRYVQKQAQPLSTWERRQGLYEGC